MLSVNNLCLTRSNTPFEWSFEVNQGQFLAIVGQSGLGKSTLLQTLLGFETADSGKLCWQGENLHTLSTAQRPFGVLFQTHNVFEHLDVKTNLAFGLTPSAKLNKAQNQAVISAAERFDVHSLLKQRCDTLSGGQQQRVALARVFLQNKPILLLDEPFSALDPKLRQEGLRWVVELQKAQHTTVLLVTHHLDEILPHADSVLEGVSTTQWNQYPAHSFLT